MSRLFALLCAGLVSQLSPDALRADETVPMPREVKTRYEVPYRLTDTKHVLVRVRLDGKGPFNFIIDTGAPALIMSEKIGEKTGVVTDKGWGKYKLEIEGGLTLNATPGLSTDMFQLKGMNAMGLAGVELHGVLGYNILSQFRIEYDFTADKLIFTKLAFSPPKMVGLGEKAKGGQGGLEFAGDAMKMLAPLMGIKPNFEMRSRGLIGIELEPTDSAVKVKSVLADSPADKAGVERGDVLVKLAGTKIADADDLNKAIAKVAAGDKIDLEVKRGEAKKTLTIATGKGL